MAKHSNKYTPTELDRKKVMLLVGFRLDPHEIAQVMTNPATGEALSEALVRREFPQELARGKALMKAKITESLYNIATGKTAQAVQAAIWWSKAQLGWKAPTETVAHTIDASKGSGVVVVPAMMAVDVWIKDQNDKNSKKKPPTKAA